MLTKDKYISIREEMPGIFVVHNTVYDHDVARIERGRMGTWMHWLLEPYDGSGEPCGTKFSNGCLKEITAFITTLYSKKAKKEVVVLKCPKCGAQNEFDSTPQSEVECYNCKNSWKL